MVPVVDCIAATGVVGGMWRDEKGVVEEDVGYGVPWRKGRAAMWR